MVGNELQKEPYLAIFIHKFCYFIDIYDFTAFMAKAPSHYHAKAAKIRSFINPLIG